MNNEKENNIDSFNSSKFTKSESKKEINQKNLDINNTEEKDYKINKEFKIGRNKKTIKNVNISDNVHVIQVESWKKYNLEQSAEPNINFFNFNNGDNNDYKNNIKKNSKVDIKCTCLLI